MSTRGLTPVSIPWERIVDVAGVLIIALAAFTGSSDFATVLRYDSGVVLGYVLVFIIGEMLRVRMPSGRITSPISTATALGLVSTTHIHGQIPFSSQVSVALLIAAAGFALGLALRRVLGRSTEFYVVAARLIGVAIAGLLGRATRLGMEPLTGDTSLGRVWAHAFSVIVAAMLGVAVQLLLTGLVRAERTRASAIGSLRDEFGEAPAVTLAVVITGPIIAMLQPVLGMTALPLALFPMALTYMSVHRFVQNRLTLRQSIVTLSRLTEAGGYTPVAHAERVARLAVQLGRSMGLVERELRDLEYAALLHDLGQIALREPIPYGRTVDAAPGDQLRIAEDGARIIRRTPVLATLAGFVEMQSVQFHRVQELGERVPIVARIIKVSNAYDDLTQGNPAQAKVTAALERIQLGMGYEYDPEVVEALIQVVHEEPPSGRLTTVPSVFRS